MILNSEKDGFILKFRLRQTERPWGLKPHGLEENCTGNKKTVGPLGSGPTVWNSSISALGWAHLLPGDAPPPVPEFEYLSLLNHGPCVTAFRVDVKE